MLRAGGHLGHEGVDEELEERVLRFEVQVERALREAAGGGDVFHPGAAQAFLGELGAGGGEEGFFGVGVGGAAHDWRVIYSPVSHSSS